MSLCASHFPVVVALRCTALHHKPRWRHQNLKNTNSNKACGDVFTANYPEKVSKCSHSPSVFSHKIDGRHVSQAVFWVAWDIRTNSVAVGVMLCWSSALSNYSLCTHSGHGTTYTVSTYITLMVIKDRARKPPAMLVKEL